MQEEAIRVEKLSKNFGENRVLRDVDLIVQKQDSVVILGSSGSGKSTLLRCLNLLELPTGGEIFVNGKQVGTPTRNGIKFTNAELQKVRTSVGMVFQQFNLFPHMTVIQNVMEGQVSVLGRSKSIARERSMEMLAKVGLAEKASEYPSRLSGGQQQRTAIARALAMDPQIMLFDEVTSALDPELVGEVLRVMRTLRDEGLTMVTVTHELGFAYQAADRIIFLHEGGIYEEGHPHKVLVSPERERTKAFLDGHNQFRMP